MGHKATEKTRGRAAVRKHEGTMATVLIEPIKTLSLGGYDVTITGISPADNDCIVGRIDTSGQGLIDGRWDLSGTHRGGIPKTNIDMSTDDLPELVALARQLGAT